MESKGTSFILIIIVAVLALTLAALAGYLFIVQGSSNSDKNVPTANGTTVKDVPKEEDLVKIPLYESARFFNLKSADPEKTSIIQVMVTMKCYKTLKHDKKAVVSEIISSRSDEIQELVTKFFLTLTIDQVKDPAVMDKAKVDLKKQINEMLNEGNKDPEDIIYTVIFSEWISQ
ncbi:MAG TPA: flagellar basal body-associated FliL family protein [Clostridia bacterium]|nr:flagellar basal body-associated FliL family protein [Clostridia bacterium]